MVFKYLFSLFLLFSISANAQIGSIINYRHTPKTQHSQTKTKRIDNSRVLEQLAHNITKNKFTETEKVEAIYFWITKNIAYDHELRYSKKLQKAFYNSEDKVIQKVLQRHKALCGGFAFLFEKLCNQAGIEAKSIHGFTKLATTYSKPNHTWNAVRLNGKWQLLDITWSISNGSSNTPNRYWYLTSPKDFIKSHYPENANWTLIKKPQNLLSFINK